MSGVLAVSEDNLRFGSWPGDPTGVHDCDTCHGRRVVNGTPCSRCQARQQVRNAWWAGSTGPDRVRRQLDGL